MPTERKSQPLAAFFKFTKRGQQIAGKVSLHRVTENGPMVVFTPAVIRHDKSGPMMAFASVALGLSTDLRFKIGEGDKGKYFSVEFIETEWTAKDSEKKIFRVLELSREEIIAISASADMTHRDSLYSPKIVSTAVEAGESGDVTASKEDDDLPF